MIFSSTFKIYTLVNSKVELDEEESDLTAEENSPINDARTDSSCTRFFSPCTDFEIFTGLFGFVHQLFLNILPTSLETETD